MASGARRFKFISPGVYLNEIDRSQLPAEPTAMGPIIIGRTEKGPGMVPIRVASFEEFTRVFGAPNPGGGGGDNWREGDFDGPTYASYAAQAWLRSGEAPATIVRLLGAQHQDATTAGLAGWDVTGAPTKDLNSNGGAYGLFLISSGSVGVGATATITTVAESSLVDTRDFTLTDAAGTTTTYNISTGLAVSNNTDAYTPGGQDGKGPAGTITIGMLGATSRGDVRDQIVARINAGTAIGFTAAASGDDVLITQNTLGTAGNTTITQPDGSTGLTIPAAFAGGVGPDGGTFQDNLTGSLAAIWYMNQGTSIRISGTLLNEVATEAKAGTAKFFKNNGSDAEFVAEVFTGGDVPKLSEKICFNFNRDSEKYIRKVFNTNPSQTNSNIVSAADNPNYYTYWLGETFDQHVTSKISSTAAGDTYGVMLGLISGSKEWADHQKGFQNAETPYFRGQDLGDRTNFDVAAMPPLFKLVSLEFGEWANRNIKVSIENLRHPDYPTINPYGSFSIVLRHAKDRDEDVKVLERFDNLDLNPNSENYVARRIGDMYLKWDGEERRLRQYGNYQNRSDYVRVVVDNNVDQGAVEPELLPFSCLGPPRFKGFSLHSGSSIANTFGVHTLRGDQVDASIVKGGVDVAYSGSEAGVSLAGAMLSQMTASFEFASVRLRLSASDGGLTRPTDAYFGIQTTRDASSTLFDPSYYDMVRALPDDTNSFSVGTYTEHSFKFSMDDVVSGSSGYYYLSGSRRSGNSYTAQSATTYKSLIDAGYNKFTVPMFGGFDGLDITEKEPFRNSRLDDAGELGNYTFNTVKRAIDTIADPEFVEANLMVIPGVKNSTLTQQLVDVCETRGDALAIIDIENDYVPYTENTADLTARLPNVKNAISSMRTRGINSSYGCCFFPWVQIRDTGNGRLVNVPPSVAALGTFASSQARTEVWFAPAGFVRGGLSNGAAGIPVTNVKLRLTSKNRDDLYGANINPIATFPNEGIVIFGQKTLQVTRSALDRINVRRLMIFVKKEISRIANSILFEPNVQATWDRFTSAVNPFLADVKARFGLTDFRVVLDNTTTTDELIDRNILYAKIYLKPARAIEFIALDFIITRTGASFDD